MTAVLKHFNSIKFHLILFLPEMKQVYGLYQYFLFFIYEWYSLWTFFKYYFLVLLMDGWTKYYTAFVLFIYINLLHFTCRLSLKFCQTIKTGKRRIWLYTKFYGLRFTSLTEHTPSSLDAHLDQQIMRSSILSRRVVYDSLLFLKYFWISLLELTHSEIVKLLT